MRLLMLEWFLITNHYSSFEIVPVSALVSTYSSSESSFSLWIFLLLVHCLRQHEHGVSFSWGDSLLQSVHFHHKYSIKHWKDLSWSSFVSSPSSSCDGGSPYSSSYCSSSWYELWEVNLQLLPYSLVLSRVDLLLVHILLEVYWKRSASFLHKCLEWMSCMI